MLLVLSAPGPAAGHPLRVAVADITVGPAEVELRLSLNLAELDLLLSLDRDLDGRVDPNELALKQAALSAYLADRVHVRVGAEPLAMTSEPAGVARSADGRDVIESRLTFRARGPIEAPLTIECAPLADLGADHHTLATIRRGGRLEQFVFRPGVRYEAQPASFAGAAGRFLALGVHHIFVGYDHIAFLVGLVVTGGTLLGLVKIVTAFTLAHSVTLSLAVLDVLTLPARLVEAGIALSVAYVGLENLLARGFDHRWLVSFAFGLVHGFGFAGVLREMSLPRGELVSSLLFFNVGVELGQVAIAVVVLPLVWLLARRTLHRPVARAASLVIFAAGVVWLYQRAF